MAQTNIVTMEKITFDVVIIDTSEYGDSEDKDATIVSNSENSMDMDTPKKKRRYTKKQKRKIMDEKPLPPKKRQMTNADQNDGKPTGKRSYRGRRKIRKLGEVEMDVDQAVSIVRDMDYDYIRTPENESKIRIPDTDHFTDSDIVKVDGNIDLNDHEKVAATILCMKTSREKDEKVKKPSVEWTRTMNRQLNGIGSQTRSRRGNPDTPESIGDTIAKAEQELIQNSVVAEAVLLPPHIEKERQDGIWARAASASVDKDIVNEKTEICRVAESTGIGLMKHLVPGRNIEIREDGQYSFHTKASIVKKTEDVTHDNKKDNTSALKDNIPIDAQLAYQKKVRTSSQAVQEAIEDYGVVIPGEGPLTGSNNKMLLDPRTQKGILRRSPLMRNLTPLLRYKATPYFFAAAEDGAKDDMYPDNMTQNLPVDDGRPRIHSYNPNDAMDVEREIKLGTSHDDDRYPLIPRISKKVEESFLREAFPGEPPCSNKENCAAMFLQDIEPMILVSFYGLEVALQEFMDSQTSAADTTTVFSGTSTDSVRSAMIPPKDQSFNFRGVSSNYQNKKKIQPSWCVLCHRQFAMRMSSAFAGQNATLPKGAYVAEYCNITGVVGEYKLSSCFFNVNTRYAGLPGPIAIHTTTMYRRRKVTSPSGVTVFGLIQQHETVGFETTLNF